MTNPDSRPEARFILKLMRYRTSEACDAVYQLESLVAKNPARLLIDLMGFRDIPPDMALLIRSVLEGRSPKTELTTFAKSSLRGNATLIWLLGDRRFIREDARLYFRRPEKGVDAADSPEEEGGWQEPEEPSLHQLFGIGDVVEEEDYRRVVALIDNYLPVGELTGKQIEVKTLKEFGLVDCDRLDQLLAGALLTSVEPQRGTVITGHEKIAEGTK
jgi:hypothetical protein